MLYNNRLLLLLLVLLVSCSDKPAGKTTAGAKDSIQEKNDSDKIKPALIPWTDDKPGKGQYCYISKVFMTGDTSFIEADYIQFLMGEKAITAARKKNDALMEVNAKGDTTWSLLDDIYIINDNTMLITLPVAGNAEILLIQMDGKPYFRRSTLKELKSRADKNSVYILTINSDQVVTQIKQQYLP